MIFFNYSSILIGANINIACVKLQLYPDGKAWMLLFLIQPCSTSSKVFSLVIICCLLFILVYSYLLRCYIFCLDVCSNPAVLNNTVVVTVPYRYRSRGDSEKCSADLLPFSRIRGQSPVAAPPASRSPQLMLINSEIHTSFSGLIWLDAVLQSVIRAGPVSAVCKWQITGRRMLSRPLRGRDWSRSCNND